MEARASVATTKFSDRLNQEIAVAKIPRRYWGVSFDDFEVVDANRKAFKVVKSYVGDLEGARSSCRNLLLGGKPRVGKTMLASLIAKEAIAARYRTYFMTVAWYVEMHLRMIDLKEAWSKMGDEEQYERWKRLDYLFSLQRNFTEFLIFDDIGKEHRTASLFAKDLIVSLVRRREQLGLPTIMTTNHPVTELATMYDASLGRFISEEYRIVSVGERP